jgi:hypothetical protein
VKITLADQGRGIAAHHLDKIFDPYFSTQERGSVKGSGLGLAIVHSIINKHEGKISVDSTLGRGTTFTLYLPAEAPSEQRGGGTAAILPAGRGTVLVMRASGETDDLAEMLHHIGFAPRFLTEPSAVVESCGEAMRLGESVAGILAEFADNQVKEAAAFLAGLRQVDQRVPVIVSCNDRASELFRDNTRHGFSGAVSRPYKLLDLNRVLAVLKSE